MLPETIQFEIVTPDRLVLKDEVNELQIPGKNGYLGILPGHAPLITTLTVGELSYRKNKVTRYLSVAGGYCEVLPDRVTLLADTAEKPEEIDVGRALAAKGRAEKRLADSQNSEIDLARSMVSLQRAIIRIQVSQKRVPS
jgi:F-type H+-transporting ATPase subunit epsilon